MFLAECCRERTVHLLVRKQLGPGMSEYLVRRIKAAQNIVLHEGVEIAAFHGQQRMEGVTLRAYSPNNGESQDKKSSETLPISAAFVFMV